MLSLIIAAFCIIDDALQAMGYKDDPQGQNTRVRYPYPGDTRRHGTRWQHNKALALAKT
jgi:hypothetical protein